MHVIMLCNVSNLIDDKLLRGSIGAYGILQKGQASMPVLEPCSLMKPAGKCMWKQHRQFGCKMSSV